MKYFITIILVSVLAACNRSNYQHSVTKDVFQEENHHQEQKTVEKQTEETETTSTQEETETESLKIEFDTEKPADPETGLPPVKNITYTGSKKKETGTNQKQGTTQEKETSQEESKQNINKESETEVQEETQIKTKGPGLIRVLVYILAIVGAYWLHDLIRKNWSRIKTIWKK